MKIKVCGMREPQNIADVVALGIDYIGFIFYEKSPRCVCAYPPELLVQTRGVQTPITANAISWGKTQKVGVFVNHSIDFVLEKVKTFDLDLVQLHGHETVEFCEELKKRLEKIPEKLSVSTHTMAERKVVCEDTDNGGEAKIIKVFSIGDAFDFSQLNDYKPLIDYFLFDTKGKDLGGNGITFNWEILKSYDNEVPFFLSGGIDIQHVEEINQLQNLNIHALDINSKFEVSAGVKDVGKIRNFMEMIKKLTPKR